MNWFMPAFTNMSVSRAAGAGRSGEAGTMVCCFSLKKSRKLLRISAEVMTGALGPHFGERGKFEVRSVGGRAHAEERRGGGLWGLGGVAEEGGGANFINEHRFWTGLREIWERGHWQGGFE